MFSNGWQQQQQQQQSTGRRDRLIAAVLLAVLLQLLSMFCFLDHVLLPAIACGYI
jgi:hypothetical protein